MRPAKTITAAILTGSLWLTWPFVPSNARADWRWCSCRCGCRDGLSPQERIAVAADLGLRGGAPGLGFCGSVTGYGRGIVRVPFPAANAEMIAGGMPTVMPPMGIVPSPPLPPPTSFQPNPTDRPQMPPAAGSN